MKNSGNLKKSYYLQLLMATFMQEKCLQLYTLHVCEHFALIAITLKRKLTSDPYAGR